MKIEEIQACSFASWYPIFEQVTIESKLIALPPEVVDYLLADGITLPSDHNESLSYSFPENVVAEINGSISALGGSVFPKLNWSSPKDASWIAPGHSVQCKSVDDIVLLLKSSDFCNHDLSEPFMFCADLDTADQSAHVDYVLVLRKWMEIAESSEFRCFVRNSQLIAIAQRHHKTFVSGLIDKEEQVRQCLVKFFSEKLCERFPSCNFTFDVFLEWADGESAAPRVVLVDFNPWGFITDSLLYTWDELESLNISDHQKIPLYRVLTEQPPISSDPYSALRVPAEMHNLEPTHLDQLINTANQAAEAFQNSRADAHF